MKQMPVVVPSKDSQKEIATYLNAKHSKYADLIDTIQKEIEVLKELRTRLVADVVIGKIDVRGIEIPEYEFLGEDVDDGNNEIEEETEEQED